MRSTASFAATAFSVLLLVLAGVTVGACGDEGATDDPPDGLVDAPPPPPGGVQLVGTPFTVPAASEVFFCMEIAAEIASDLFVSESKVYQVEGGHHVIVFYSEATHPVDPEPHPCGDLDMVDIRLVGTGSGYGAGVELPPGKALKIPRGARLFFQSHYLNTADHELRVQDVVNLGTIPESEVTDNVGSFAHVDLGFSLPPGQETTRTMRCEIPWEMHPTNLFPHMHEWGHHFLARIERASETVPIFDVDWESAFRDDFPEYDDVDSLVFQQGDILETTCTWRNTEPETLLFPREMCVTFFLFYPSPDGALLACDENGYLSEV
jgi:hypothetical protein